ncbi:MAG: hypothetical protein COB04_09110 [Gammaproteobacteria bacterium]|nr:MAG: hypothetical protein COB04_09110 [Gammaproteobacteria bacterium]
MLGLSGNLEVIHSLTSWLTQGRHAWLATVLKTYGSSPRPPGSLMALNQDGLLTGSISGGCIEEQLLNQLSQGNQATQPTIIDYGINTHDQIRFKLPCGGHLKILIEPLTPRHQEHFKSVQHALDQGHSITREISPLDGSLRLHPPEPATPNDKQGIYHTLGPQAQLLLLGAGQISQILARIAASLDYRIAVCDPRPQFAQSWPIDTLPHVEFSTLLPDDFIRHNQVNASTAIVALSHDPRVDDMALMEALSTDAFYIGAMGSKSSSENRRQRLISLDLSAEQIDKLHAPVGLDIASKTPAEIAISILAHMTQIKNQQQLFKNPVLYAKQ